MKKYGYCKIPNCKEKYCHKKEKSKKESTNITKEIFHYYCLLKNFKHKIWQKIFIADLNATPHIVNTDESMTNIENFETQITIWGM